MIKKTLYSAPEMKFAEAKPRRVICGSFDSPDSGDGTEGYDTGNTDDWF